MCGPARPACLTEAADGYRRAFSSSFMVSRAPRVPPARCRAVCVLPRCGDAAAVRDEHATSVGPDPGEGACGVATLRAVAGHEEHRVGHRQAQCLGLVWVGGADNGADVAEPTATRATRSPLVHQARHGLGNGAVRCGDLLHVCDRRVRVLYIDEQTVVSRLLGPQRRHRVGSEIAVHGHPVGGHRRERLAGQRRRTPEERLPVVRGARPRCHPAWRRR